MDTRYNGWTNYATWRVYLEIFSDFEDDMFGEEGDAKWVEDYTNTVVFGSTDYRGLMADYAYAFLSEVNYAEIANHLNELIED
jgi:hypothetical protein